MYTLGPLISPQPQSPPGFSTTFPDFSWISRKQEVKQLSSQTTLSTQSFEMTSPQTKKKAQNSQLTAEVGLHHWISRLRMAIVLSFLGLLVGQLFGKLLSGFQLGNHQVCLKYWKILKGPKYLRNKDFPPFHGWIFGAHFCFWWILGSLEYQRLQRTQKNSNIFHYSTVFEPKITTWILRSHISVFPDSCGWGGSSEGDT